MRRPRHRLFARTVLALVLATAPGLARADDNAIRFDPRFRAGAPSDALEAGPPRLSRGHLDAFVDLFETAFDAALGAQVERDLRDALRKEYAQADAKERERFLQLVDAIVDLKTRARCCQWQWVYAGLRTFRAEIDRRVRTKPKEPANRLMLRVLRRRHEVIWEGEPALKGLAVDAYLEMAVFATSLARNEAVTLSPGQLGALRDYLGRDLLECAVRTRECLTTSHRLWLRVKARWDRSRDERRLAMRWEAVKLQARLAPGAGGLTVRRGADGKAYAREASKVAAADEAFDAVTALARNPAALFDALCRGLGLGGKAPPFPFQYR